MPRFQVSEIASLPSGLFRGQMVVLLQTHSYESLVSLAEGWHWGGIPNYYIPMKSLQPCVGNLKSFPSSKRNLCKKQENNC